MAKRRTGTPRRIPRPLSYPVFAGGCAVDSVGLHPVLAVRLGPLGPATELLPAKPHYLTDECFVGPPRTDLDLDFLRGCVRHTDRLLALDPPERSLGDARQRGEASLAHALLFAQALYPLAVHHHVHASPP